MRKFNGFLVILILLMGCHNKSAKQSEQMGQSDGSHAEKSPANPEYLTSGTIERIDPAINDIIDADAKIEVLGDGYEWLEGPVWVADHHFLLFSDVMTNSVYKWSEKDGVQLYLKPSGYTGATERGEELGSNGLLVDHDGKLVLCQHGNRQIARMDAPLESPEPKFITIADNYQGKKLNSPNDLIQRSNGDIYFTDPAYGLEQKMDDPAKELSFQGVYKVSPQGELTLLTKDLTRPNGLAFSPDESTLYVANSDADHAVWMAYEVTADGSIQNGRIFYDVTDLTKSETGLPDGMKVDRQGVVFATGPGGIWIFSPEGKVLGKIHTGQATANCAFGFEGKWLYITADMLLLRIPLK